MAQESIRFAGDACWSPPTVIHWAMVPKGSLAVLAARGVRVLSGFFVPYTGSNYVKEEERADAPTLHWDLNYHLDEERSEYLSRHDALKDFESGIVFSRGDIVCNTTPVDRVAPSLRPLAEDPDTAEIMDIFTHEQYFWQSYPGYRPDHTERCEAAIRFCTDHGYRPVFLHDGFLGAT